MSSTETTLVTGCAGFIGFHVAQRLLDDGCRVLGLDNLNDYYDPGLKRARLARLHGRKGFEFEAVDLADPSALASALAGRSYRTVLHFAAQAGVRHSIDHPRSYVAANLAAFVNVLEACRTYRVRHLIFASSSSVYGANTRLPFRTSDNVDHPLNLYAATKKANEAMAHSYAHLFGIAATGLRLFTVYGPWGRPDMAVSLFADAIASGRPIRLFGEGRMRRDHTFIDDVVAWVARLVEMPPTGEGAWSGDEPDPATSSAPWRLLNVGSGRTVEMLAVVRRLEELLGRDAVLHPVAMQPGEVSETWADVEPLIALTGYRPKTSIEDGLERFVHWRASMASSLVE